MLATCLGCGCVCDDIELDIEGNRIADARNACSLGAQWFGDGNVSAHVLVRGTDVPVDEALRTAVDVLRRASRPLVFLAPDISCETQRAAIGLADVLRADIDSVTSATTRASILAAQEAGRASATLGEIRNRADVIVFWGVDPSHRYPRFSTRYAPDPIGVHVGGRRSRTVIAVDVGSARAPQDADLRLTVMPDRETAILTEFASIAMSQQRRGSNAPVLDAIVSGKYVAIIADAEPDAVETRDGGRSAALIALAQALNSPTRCALISLRAGGNRSGADACLTAQTGYPMAVNFSRGYPRYLPYDDASVRVARGGVDAMLVVGSAGLVPRTVLDGSGGIPTVIIGPRATESPIPGATVAIDTAVVGIHEAGTVLRMDDVPLPVAAALPGPPSTFEVVAALARTMATGAVAPVAKYRP
jgi:formylmethanofuran dehydrogenase subunit B